jgi:DNA polymerase elongation subunit (family B)
MTEFYYLDIETFVETEKIIPKDNSIITIAYQNIDSRTGQSKNKLNILKTWESSEEDVLRKFLSIFNPFQDDPFRKWDFVPVGFNLRFDFASLLYRCQKIGINLS